MKAFKVVIIVFVITTFILGCSPKNLSGTYQSFPITPTHQSHSRIILNLFSDSTFRYLELKGSCWYDTGYESAGKWARLNNTIILNSSKLAYDTIALFNSKKINYKKLTNHVLVTKKKETY